MYFLDESPAKDCVFSNVTLIDGTGADPVSNANIWIKDGMISEITTSEEKRNAWLAMNPDLEVIHGEGMYLLPGLMDSHIHVHGYANTDPTVVKLWHLPTHPTMKFFHAVKNLALLLEAGFTAVRHCGIMTYDLDNCVRDAIKAELFPGPRVLTCGHDISMTAGHGDLFTPPWATPLSGPTADGVDECVKAVRTRLRQGADFIKIHASGGVMSEGDPIWWRNYSEQEISAICEEAHAFHRKVSAHAHGTEGIKVALRGGVDSIEHGSLMDDEGRELMLEKDAYLVPTLATTASIVKNGLKTGAPPASIEKGSFMYKKAQENLKKAYRMGIKIANGSDCFNLLRVRYNRQEFDELFELEIPPLEIIKMATHNAADLLGILDETGTIEVGKTADIIMLCDNPLKDISALGSREKTKLVMRYGKIMINKL